MMFPAQSSLSSSGEGRKELIFGTLPFLNAKNPNPSEFLSFEIFLTLSLLVCMPILTHHENNGEIFFAENSTGFGFLAIKNGSIQKISSFGASIQKMGIFLKLVDFWKK